MRDTLKTYAVSQADSATAVLNWFETHLTQAERQHEHVAIIQYLRGYIKALRNVEGESEGE